MVLGVGKILSIDLGYDRPGLMEILVNESYRYQEVSRIGKPVTSDRSQIWKLPARAKDFNDIAPRFGCTLSRVQDIFDTPGDHCKLPGLKVKLSKLRLDIQVAQLRDKEAIAVSVEEGSVVHGVVDGVNVES